MKASILGMLMFSLAFFTSITYADTAYLSVSKWESCSIAFQKGPFKLFCLPKSKPAACPDASWNTLKSRQMLPLCPLCPPK